MTDPLRWTEDGADASSFERELLSEGQGMGLSAAQKQQSWAGILLHAAPGVAAVSGVGKVAGGQSVAPGAAQAASWGFGSKVVGVASLLGVLGGGYWATMQGDVPAEPLPQEATTPTQSVTSPEAAAVALAQSGSELVEPRAAERDSVNAKISVPVTPQAKVGSAEQTQISDQQKRASRLREESLAVLEIRRTLRAGNPSRALSLLDQARRDFPDGALGQEREALTIEALVGSGAREFAQKRAQAFLKNYPKSPFAADVTRFSTP